jgi:hypothetical protein
VLVEDEIGVEEGEEEREADEDRDGRATTCRKRPPEPS